LEKKLSQWGGGGSRPHRPLWIRHWR